MNSGIWVLLAAVVATVVLAWWYQTRNGRFRTPAPSETDVGDVPESVETLSAGDIGEPLGERATLVQFSSSFCAPCRATRVVLSDVASKVDGVEAVDVDAESHLELVRRIGILRTPTTLILDAHGAVITRAGGVPTRDQVMSALAAIPGLSDPSSQIAE